MQNCEIYENIEFSVLQNFLRTLRIYGKYWIIPVFSLLCSILVHRYFRYTPPLNDGGVFAAIGEKISEGKSLYLDVWDNKAPGIFLLNSLFLKIFSNPLTAMAAMRFVFVFFLSFFLAKTVWWVRTSYPFLLLLLIPWCWFHISTWEFFMSGSYTEFYGSVFILGALFAIRQFQISKKPVFMFVCGLLLAAASMIKEPFIISAVIFFLYIIIQIKTFQLNALFSAVTGFIVLWLWLISYFAWSGSLPGYMEYLKFAFSYAGSGETNHWIELQNFVTDWYNRFPIFVWLILPFMCSVFDLKYLRENFYSQVFIFILFLSQLVFVFLGETTYSHYFLPVIIFSCVLIIQGMSWVFYRILLAKNKLISNLFFGVCAIFISILLVKQSGRFLITEKYPLALKATEERDNFMQKIISYRSFYIAKEDLGRYYLYSNKEVAQHFPCPYAVYFLGDQTIKKSNHRTFAAELVRYRPEMILTGPMPNYWMNHPDFEGGHWFESHYDKQDSMLTAEGDMAYFWVYKR